MTAVLVILLAGILAAPLPGAQAGTSKGSDEVGDANPGVDITKVKLFNDKRSLKLRVDILELDVAEYWRTVATFQTKRRSFEYTVVVRRRDDGTWKRTVEVTRPVDDGGARRIRCPGVRHRLSADNSVVFIRLPQRCVAAKVRGKVRASVVAGQNGAPGAPYDDHGPGAYWTPWAARG